MIASVALPLPLPKTFLYRVPDEMSALCLPFTRVRVPFGPRILTGYILETEDGDGSMLKEVQEVVDPFPLLDEQIIELCRFVSRFFLTPLGLVLKYALPPSFVLDRFIMFQLEGSARALPLAWAFKHFGRTKAFILVKDRQARLIDRFTERQFRPICTSGGGRTDRVLFLGSFESRLEYYKAAIKDSLEAGENVLFFTPDYPHSATFLLKRLREAFPEKVHSLGSHTKEKERAGLFFMARNEGGLIFVGHKRAAFLPMINNGLVIMDRPEDEDYFNKEAPKFHVMNLAIKRAELLKARLILGTLSPPFELYRLMREGQFVLEKGTVPRPELSVIGMGGMERCAKTLGKIVRGCMERRKKVAIFVSRTDYAGRIFCEHCRKALVCPSCERPFSFRKSTSLLSCPVCGKEEQYKGRCPSCGGELLSISEPGLECVQEWLADSVPSARILKFEGRKTRTDSTVQVILGSYGLSRAYGTKVDSLVFLLSRPLWKLFGFRVRERIFQILSNMIDALRPSSVFLIVQTKMGLIPTLDMDKLYEMDLEERKSASFPPFSRFVAIDLQGPRQGQFLTKLHDELKRLGLESYILGSLKRTTKNRLILKDVPEEMYEALIGLYELPGVRIIPDPEPF